MIQVTQASHDRLTNVAPYVGMRFRKERVSEDRGLVIESQ